MKLLVVHEWGDESGCGTFVRGFESESKEQLFLDLEAGISKALQIGDRETTISGSFVYVPNFTIWSKDDQRNVVDYESLSTILTLEEYFDYVK